MKAKYTGKISEVSKNDDGDVQLKVSGLGKVDTTLLYAKETSCSGTFIFKEMITNKMMIGSTITITISDEELD